MNLVASTVPGLLGVVIGLIGSTSMGRSLFNPLLGGSGGQSTAYTPNYDIEDPMEGSGADLEDLEDALELSATTKMAMYRSTYDMWYQGLVDICREYMNLPQSCANAAGEWLTAQPKTECTAGHSICTSYFIACVTWDWQCDNFVHTQDIVAMSQTREEACINNAKTLITNHLNAKPLLVLTDEEKAYLNATLVSMATLEANAVSQVGVTITP